MLRAVRGMEREQDQIKSKVDDLWREVPKMNAILDPLHVQLSPGPAVGDLQVQAEASLEALKPLSGVLEASLQRSIDQLRHDLVGSLSEMRGGLEGKASANDMHVLQDRWRARPAPTTCT